MCRSLPVSCVRHAMGDAPDRKKEEKKNLFIDCCGVGGKKLGTYAMPVNAGSALGLPGNGRSILIQAFGI